MPTQPVSKATYPWRNFRSSAVILSRKNEPNALHLETLKEVCENEQNALHLETLKEVPKQGFSCKRAILSFFGSI